MRYTYYLCQNHTSSSVFSVILSALKLPIYAGSFLLDLLESKFSPVWMGSLTSYVGLFGSSLKRLSKGLRPS